MRMLSAHNWGGKFASAVVLVFLATKNLGPRSIVGDVGGVRSIRRPILVARYFAFPFRPFSFVRSFVRSFVTLRIFPDIPAYSRLLSDS